MDGSLFAKIFVHHQQQDDDKRRMSPLAPIKVSIFITFSGFASPHQTLSLSGLFTGLICVLFCKTAAMLLLFCTKLPLQSFQLLHINVLQAIRFCFVCFLWLRMRSEPALMPPRTTQSRQVVGKIVCRDVEKPALVATKLLESLNFFFFECAVYMFKTGIISA